MTYFNDESFSNAFYFSMELEESDYQYVTRNELLLQLCKGKRVVHLGFLDHNKELVRKKIKKNLVYNEIFALWPRNTRLVFVFCHQIKFFQIDAI